MNGLRDKRSGIVGMVLLGVVVLLFVIFVGKRVWDANQDDNGTETLLIEETDDSR